MRIEIYFKGQQNWETAKINYANMSCSILKSPNIDAMNYVYYSNLTMKKIMWASTQENLSSGFPSKRVSNQSPKLQSLAHM